MILGRIVKRQRLLIILYVQPAASQWSVGVEQVRDVPRKKHFDYIVKGHFETETSKSEPGTTYSRFRFRNRWNRCSFNGHVHVHLYKANFGHLCKHAARSPTQLRSLVAKHHPAAPPARFQLCGAAVAQYFSSQNSISTTLQQPSLLMTSRKQAFLLKLSI